MDYERVNRKVFVWSERLAKSGRRDVHRKMINYFEEIGMNHFSNINQIGQYGEIKADFDLVLSEFYEYKWYQKVSSVTGVNGSGRNKLRTYKNFKRELRVEHYVKAPLSRGERSAMAKFRMGVAPIKLETGRYTRTPEDERLGVLCQLNEIESEEHVLIQCPLYCNIRNVLFHAATNIYDDFNDLYDTDKLSFILSNGSIIIDSSIAEW